MSRELYSLNHYGLYRAVVKDNKDPKNLRRLKLQVAQTTGSEVTDWAWPVISTKRPPAIGTGVYVTYIGGDPEYPVWIGEFGKPDTLQGVFGYGSWHSTQDQTGTVNSVNAMTVNNKDYEEGIRVVSNSRFTVDYDAIYNIQFSAQFHHTGGGGNGNTVNVWFRKNGTDIPNSNTKLTVQSNNPYVVASWNFFYKLKKNDYLQIVWSSDNASIKLEHEAAGSHPAVPSVIVTMNQIA